MSSPNFKLLALITRAITIVEYSPNLFKLSHESNPMKAQYIICLFAALTFSAGTSASECTLTVGDESFEFAYVYAVAETNPFDDSKEDVKIYCFREEVPADKQSASDIIWVTPDSGQVVINVSWEHAVTSVNLATPELTAAISGANFGIEFDGSRTAAGKLQGSIRTTEDQVTHFNGVESAPWRLSAALDLEILPE